MLLEARLKNCQSLQDVCYKFAQDKLNVIIGDNDYGKSVFFKILRLAISPSYYNKEEYQNLIRWEEEFLEAQYLFSDGAIGVVRLYNRGPIYYFKGPEADSFTTTLEPCQEFIDGFGAIADPVSGFVANIINKSQETLLVDKSLKANYECVSMLVVNHKLNEIVDKSKERNNEWGTKERDLNIRLHYLNAEIEKYSYVDVESLRDKLNVDEAAFEIVYTLIDVYQKLDMLSQSKAYSINFEEAFNFVSCVEILESLHSIAESMVIVNKFDNNLLVFVDVLETLESLDTLIGSMSYNSSYVNHSVELAECLSLIERLYYSIPDVLEDIDYDSAITALDLYEQLEILFDLTERIEGDMLTSQETYGQIQNWLAVLSENGAIKDCPIHGEVIYDGENCLPFNI